MYTDKAVRVNSQGSERGGGGRWLPHLAHLSDDGNGGLMNRSESERGRFERDQKSDCYQVRLVSPQSAEMFSFLADVDEWDIPHHSTGSHMLISEERS